MVTLEEAMTAQRAYSAAVVLVTFLGSACATAQSPTQAELNAASSNVADWLHTNHDYGGQRFVAATEINRQNAPALRPACRYELGDLYPFHTNPIVYRGVMYLTTPYATIALDAVTCGGRWRHDWESKARENWPQNRGVAVKGGKVIRGTRDGYLLALDAETGRPRQRVRRSRCRRSSSRIS
jgi:glucose dehydrogenase